MSTFWIIAALMIIATVALVLWPLLGNYRVTPVDRKALNIDLLRAQAEQLEQDLKHGLISTDAYQEARDEIESSVIRDVSEDAAISGANHKPKILAATLSIVLPIAAIVSYQQLGSPNLTVVDASQPATQVDVENMVAGLAQRLESTPDDIDGWTMLGKSYMVMRRYADAKKVFSNLIEKKPNDTALLLNYADASAMQANGNFIGEPYDIIKKILTLDPDNVQARWMAGLAENQLGNPETALTIWNPLLLELQQQSPELAAELQRMIATLAPPSGSTSEDVAGTSTQQLRIKVAIAPELLAAVSANDTLFVYARAMQGPPMPLAIQRYNAGQIPELIILDDSTAMMPEMRLSLFPEVKIDARVSKTGAATPQVGDLFGRIENVTINTAEILYITVDQRIE